MKKASGNALATFLEGSGLSGVPHITSPERLLWH